MASGTLVGDEAREKQRWGNIKVYTRKKFKKCNQNKTGNNCIPSQPPAMTTRDGASNEYSNRNMEVATTTNGVLNSVFTRVENRVRVNVSAARSKTEIDEARKKLSGELELVRSSMKKFEAKEVEINGYTVVRGYNRPQKTMNEYVDKGNGQLMVNCEAGSVAKCNSLPFQGLNVVVTESYREGSDELYNKDTRTPISSNYYSDSQFAYGMEKCLALGNNKKLNSNGYGLGKHFNQAFKSCSYLLIGLVKHTNSWLFKAPVDVQGLGLHDYHTIIKYPMDLGTIRTKLTKKMYNYPRDFAEDVRLTFRNAMTYNPKGHAVHTVAEDFLKIFEEKWAVIEGQYNLDGESDISHERGLPTPTSRRVPTPHPLPLAPPSQVSNLDNLIPKAVLVDSRMETPYISSKPSLNKPTTNSPHKKNMTWEEKQKLGIDLQNLPPDKMDNIVEIIRKRNTEVCELDDEIEVDIDSVDAETLWELDRFMSDYKKSLSKIERNAEIDSQTRLETDNMIQSMDPVPIVVEVDASKESRHGHDAENVAVPVQEKEGGPTTSSSSSGSDSGSSSSDSDSESSSSSGSDLGHLPGT